VVRAAPERSARAVRRALREYQKWVRRWTSELTYCVSCDRPHLQQVSTGAGRFIHTVVRLLWMHSNTARDLHSSAPSRSLCSDYRIPSPPLTTNTNVFYDFILCMGYWPIVLASYIILPL
jgi:hypothetical protein